MSTYAGKDPIPTQAVIADEGAWPDLLTVPTDEAPITAASFNASIKGLADRTVWLARRLVNGLEGGSYAGALTFTNIVDAIITGTLTGNIIKAIQFQYANPTVFNRTVESIGRPQIGNDGDWAFANADWEWATVTTTSHPVLVIPLHLANGAVLNSVTGRIKGPTHAAFPADKPDMPTLTVWKKTLATGAMAQLTTTGATDTSATHTAYAADHDITATLVSPYTCNRTIESYFAAFSAEGAGAGAVIAGTRFHGAKVNYTLTVAASE